MNSPITRHHTITRRVGGLLEVVRPVRDGSWWRRLIQKLRCAKQTGHCWHLAKHSWIDWWCCMCPAETDGMPDQDSVYCLAIEERERPYP